MNDEKKPTTDKPVDQQKDELIIDYTTEYLKQTGKDFTTDEYVIQ